MGKCNHLDVCSHCHAVEKKSWHKAERLDKALKEIADMDDGVPSKYARGIAKVALRIELREAICPS